MKHLAVLIPVYNEASLAPLLIERLLATPAPEGLSRRVYIVDDGSTDGTAAFVESLAQRADLAGVVRTSAHRHNRGKGAAVRTALRAALGDDPVPDLVLIQDADLEYDPRDHARLLAPILDGRADAVIGTRFGGEAHRVLYFWHYLANRLITLASNAFTNLNLSDIECCLKAMTRDVALRIRIREDRFGIEPELVAKIARVRLRDEHAPGGKRSARVFEVAVGYAGRTYAEGKKIKARDGVRALVAIVKYALFSR